MLNYRLGYYFIRKQNSISNFIVVLLRSKQIKKRNCFFSYHSKIGRNLNLPHPLSIVIGDGVQIGNNVTIYQGVTIGVKDSTLDGYPVIEDNVIIYANSIVVGSISIGENSIVGGLTLVNQNFESNSKIYGIPGKSN